MLNMKLRIVFYSSKWSWKIIDYEYVRQIHYLAPNLKYSFIYQGENFLGEILYIKKGVYFYMELSIDKSHIVTSAITWSIKFQYWSLLYTRLSTTWRGIFIDFWNKLTMILKITQLKNLTGSLWNPQFTTNSGQYKHLDINKKSLAQKVH